MRRRSSRVLIFLAIVPAAMAAMTVGRVAAQPAPIPITPPVLPLLAFDGGGVAVSGLSPSGQAVVFGVARGVEDFVANTIHRADVVTASPTGKAALDLAQPVPQQSVWVAVDLATGMVTTGAPAGFSFVPSAFRGAGKTTLASGADGIADDRPLLDVLVVRPGVGAWSATVGDGGPLDQGDPADGRIAVALSALTPLAGGPPAPSTFDPRDIVVAIDPYVLSVVVLAGVKP